MSLYYEAAAALSAPASDGGNLKTRIFGPRSSSSSSQKEKKKGVPPPAQVYALAAEACKWSAVLSEVVDRAELLVHERRRLTPVLALLLVHDLLVGKAGAVQLPAGHGLRAAVERHKARLAAELTRARLRRRAPTLAALREQVERAAAEAVSSSSLAAATRWVRINTLKTTLETQLATTFAGYQQVRTLDELFARSSGDSDAGTSSSRIYIDEHVPNLVAVPLVSSSSSSSSSSSADLTRSDAYKAGAIIFQDKASCFPAYLLDPTALGDGDMIDACAAPGNKTSHLAALLQQCSPENGPGGVASTPPRRIFAFEKDTYRAKTLRAMLRTAGALNDDDDDDDADISAVAVAAGQDFLQVDPAAERYRRVRGLLLDPSCSGSGIVGRDAMPPLCLPKAAPPPPVVGSKKSSTATAAAAAASPKGKKRKRNGLGRPQTKEKTLGQAGAEEESSEAEAAAEESLDVDDDDLQAKGGDPAAARLAALAAFQLALLLHAFRFPAARRVTYSTCSVHGEENEHVVVRALQAASRDRGGLIGGWRLLRRDEQVAGLRAWPVRGDAAAAAAAAAVCASTAEGEEGEGEKAKATRLDAAAVADACIRSYPDDGRGVMGFFVAAFVRDDEPPEPEHQAEHQRDPPQAAAISDNGGSKKKKKKNKKRKKTDQAAAIESWEELAAMEESDNGSSDWGGFDD